MPASAQAGEVLDDALDRGLRPQDALRLTRVQRPGRGAMDGPAFLRGFPVPHGTCLPLPEGS